ncbi:inosine guanosine and [Wallemia mellicola CBS 633.66]|uniref:Purine nucleoside phosphorylase n=1 Tax=Wallemia mellicola (strain ATCC MYA-4683 / CBS 633.66) TaxID=671144 RepID=I4Y8E1_WALMC|nr:inosine guanosine and [Wallemia mellicola CBS 633.66]EIM20233.1 inosine guanosine and [Wallemia mellicola CBS 633.66]|eukprot:XP_006959721.1 inosine guanosine and [Wallemia mellicola CBS 633.66]
MITDIENAVKVIKSIVPENLRHPVIGIVCGSGLGTLADDLDQRFELEYNRIPGFAESGVSGHKSKLAFGFLGKETKVPVVCMLGRFHMYEGWSSTQVVFPIRTMAHMGIESIIITNAAGSLNPQIPTGSIVTIHDHIAFPGLSSDNPLKGPLVPIQTEALKRLNPQPPQPPRFLPQSDAHSFDLRLLAHRAAHKIGIARDAIVEGVYCWVTGPTYETPAEGRLLRQAGADVVGMSTIPEVIAAHHAGVKVLVLSLVTNFVVIPDTYPSAKAIVDAEINGTAPPVYKPSEIVSHVEVLEEGQKRAQDMRRLVSEIIESRATAEKLV